MPAHAKLYSPTVGDKDIFQQDLTVNFILFFTGQRQCLGNESSHEDRLRMKTATDYMQVDECGYVSIKLFIKLVPSSES